MTIEVKQMLVKSTVLQKENAEAKESPPAPVSEGIKEEILEECRQMVIDILREEQER